MVSESDTAGAAPSFESPFGGVVDERRPAVTNLEDAE